MSDRANPKVATDAATQHLKSTAIRVVALVAVLYGFLVSIGKDDVCTFSAELERNSFHRVGCVLCDRYPSTGRTREGHHVHVGMPR